jgi:MoxR-like ATPase
MMDRFFLNTVYDGKQPMQGHVPRSPMQSSTAFHRQDIQQLRDRLPLITMDPSVRAYIRDISVACRVHEHVQGGISCNVSMDLLAAVTALAALFASSYITPDLVLALSTKALAHRVQLRPQHSEVDDTHQYWAEVQTVLERVLTQVVPPL